MENSVFYLNVLLGNSQVFFFFSHALRSYKTILIYSKIILQFVNWYPLLLFASVIADEVTV